jgi:hypothetical protein
MRHQSRVSRGCRHARPGAGARAGGVLWGVAGRRAPSKRAYRGRLRGGAIVVSEAIYVGVSIKEDGWRAEIEAGGGGEISRFPSGRCTRDRSGAWHSLSGEPELEHLAKRALVASLELHYRAYCMAGGPRRPCPLRRYLSDRRSERACAYVSVAMAETLQPEWPRCQSRLVKNSFRILSIPLPVTFQSSTRFVRTPHCNCQVRVWQCTVNHGD